MKLQLHTHAPLAKNGKQYVKESNVCAVVAGTSKWVKFVRRESSRHKDNQGICGENGGVLVIDERTRQGKRHLILAVLRPFLQPCGNRGITSWMGLQPYYQ